MSLQQSVRDIEDALTNVYQKIYKEIKKDPSYPSDLTTLHYKFNKLVYDNTRSAVQQVVIIGIERVNRKLKMQPYLTKKDIDIIEKNTDTQVESFWRKVQLAMKEEQESSPLVGGSIRDLFSATAISAVFTALADTVVSKVTQLSDAIKGKPKLRWVTRGDNKVCEICRPLSGRVFEYDDIIGGGVPRPGAEIDDGDTHYNCRCELEVV